jgi:hypothetical protein
MANMRISAPDDPETEAACHLAGVLATMIEGRATGNTACTALACLMAAILEPLPEDEFESTLAVFGDAVRVNRARIQEPPVSARN